VVNNLSAHRTKNVFEFLQANPTVRIHYTPTYSSWLNQVEIWFSKIQRELQRAMTKIFKAMPFGSARGERQDRIKSVECLNRALQSRHRTLQP